MVVNAKGGAMSNILSMLRVIGNAGLVLVVCLALSACAGNISGAPLDMEVNPAFSNAETEEGVVAFEEGDYELAYRKLKPNADQGVAMAQNTLGRMYLQGQGVSKNPDSALALFRKAASQGLANAQSNLGVMYASGQGVSQDYKQSIYWFNNAAEQGFTIAMSNLADMYEHGLGVEPNQTKADQWRAKSKGLAPAKNNEQIKVETVGEEEYQEGLQDYYGFNFKNAAPLFLQAAKKGHPEAQLMLSTMYKRGQGVAQDEAQAQFWADKAESQGHHMNDNRDRILLIDTSAKTYKATEPVGALGAAICGCPADTPFGKCKCSVSAQGECACAVEK